MSATPTPAPAADQVLGGRYRLTARIAGGGMGEVWRALDEVLGREVAVKILRREYADDPTFLERFRAEARHAANLSHHHIAAVYDFGNAGDEDSKSPFLVMELVRGEPLSAVMAREGALSPQRTLQVVGQSALGLQAAHEAGVVHRDVKPGNILLTERGDVRITDFGIARAANSVPLTATGAIMGTAFYISPEQASGGSVTPASDVYSLGIVAYECLTGRRPFAGDTPVSVALAQVRDEPPALPQSVPGPVRDLVMQMLAKEPADRPSSAGDLGRDALALVAALEQAAAPAPTVALPAGAVAAVGAADAGSDAAHLAAGDVDTEPPSGRRPTDTDPSFRLPTPQRTGWLPYLVLLALALLLVLAVSRACGPDDEPSGQVAASDAATTGSEATVPDTVEVVAADFLGRPEQDVRAELEALDLRVETVNEVAEGDAGTVRDVSPTGTVEVGTLVTIEVVTPPSDEGDDDDEGDD
jgi:serine/threonine-protein kinase